MVRALPRHGRGRRFESCPAHDREPQVRRYRPVPRPLRPDRRTAPEPAHRQQRCLCCPVLSCPGAVRPGPTGVQAQVEQGANAPSATPQGRDMCLARRRGDVILAVLRSQQQTSPRPTHRELSARGRLNPAIGGSRPVDLRQDASGHAVDGVVGAVLDGEVLDPQHRHARIDLNCHAQQEVA